MYHRSVKRAIVFVDGSNWYHKLKALLAPLGLKPRVDFDLRGFTGSLVHPDELLGVRYYIGQVRRKRGDPKSEELYAKQQQLIAFLQRQKVDVGFGHLFPYPNGTFHEKGVDILLAIEMIRLAFDDAYDVAYLLSSDTDLVPAVQECHRLRKEVVYVGSSLHGQSFGLTKAADRTILLQPKDVGHFLPRPPEDTEGSSSGAEQASSVGL